MDTALPSPRRCLHFAEWPEQDRRLWLAATDRQVARRFTQRSVFAHLRPASIEKYAEGWERYLGWLETRGELDAAEPPAQRVTPERVAAFIDTLIDLGNADYTITGRLQELRCALKVLAPGGDFGWVTHPGGIPIRQRLEMRSRSFPVHHPRRLFDWGMRLMVEAVDLPGPRRRQVQLRDGLLITILAARAPRLRSLAALTLGQQLRREGSGWALMLEEEDVKTRRAITYGLPESLTPWIERYIAVERRELLAGARTEAVWINWGGARLAEQGLEKRISWRSAKEFGTDGVFRPHRFRHCIATLGPMEDHNAPAAAACVLGISAGVAAKHYDRGHRAAAAARFHSGLAAERQRTGPLARRLFAGQSPVAPDSAPSQGEP